MDELISTNILLCILIGFMISDKITSIFKEW